MPYRSIVHFVIKAGCEAEFENAFHAAAMLERPRQISGYLGAQLFRASSKRPEYVVLGEWETRESYIKWQGMAFEGLDRSLVKRLLDTLENPEPGKLYEPV